jgi:hypothetical protein
MRRWEVNVKMYPRGIGCVIGRTSLGFYLGVLVCVVLSFSLPILNLDYLNYVQGQ